MAQVHPENGKYKLGGSKDTDLEGIKEDKYQVFTDDDKLADAQSDYPDYKWFASYTIKEGGNDVRELPEEYTITFNKPERTPGKSAPELYYYLKGSGNSKGNVYRVNHEDMPGNSGRARAKLKVGDPPLGTFP